MTLSLVEGKEPQVTFNVIHLLQASSNAIFVVAQ